jgi:LmbE family N-acetylglucosaminyl deacetylase/ActR/RegA family two-component response regulator
MDVSEPGHERGRILLIDDDPALGGYLSRVLRSRGGFHVTHELDSTGALHRIETEEWDLLITDIELPGMSGLELLDRVRALVPGLPVAVLTGHPSVDYAVTALRNSAAEFMQKPIAADDLVAKATELVEAGRKARAEGREIVLAIGAHPDDVEIGAGGTLLAHRAAGDTVAILTLSRGARGGDQAMRAREAQEAADVIGARLFLDDLEDTRIQEGDPTIGVIDALITDLQPTVVYTHSVHDVHQDHRNVHRAAMVAARRVGRVYCFQSPSATIDFRPTYFVAINEHLGRKLKAIETFGSQYTVRDYMEPDLIASTARYWSRYCAGNHAEPFETIRDRSGGPPARSGDSLSLASTPGHPC